MINDDHGALANQGSKNQLLVNGARGDTAEILSAANYYRATEPQRKSHAFFLCDSVSLW